MQEPPGLPGSWCAWARRRAESASSAWHLVQTALPAGVVVDSGRTLDITRVKLSPNNMVAIASDGVADPGNDAWLQAILMKSGDDCKVMADEILRTARIHNGGRDDMSVLVMKLAKR